MSFFFSIQLLILAGIVKGTLCLIQASTLIFIFNGRQSYARILMKIWCQFESMTATTILIFDWIMN